MLPCYELKSWQQHYFIFLHRSFWCIATRTQITIITSLFVTLLMPIYSSFDRRTRLVLQRIYYSQCLFTSLKRIAYAAVMAKTSARFAPARPMRQMDSSTLNAAMMPNLAGIECTQYSTTIDAIGMREAKRLVIQYVMR
jgi:hypothetical protein